MDATKHCRENASIFDVSHMCGLTLKVLLSFWSLGIIAKKLSRIPMLNAYFGNIDNSEDLCSLFRE